MYWFLWHNFPHNFVIAQRGSLDFIFNFHGRRKSESFWKTFSLPQCSWGALLRILCSNPFLLKKLRHPPHLSSASTATTGSLQSCFAKQDACNSASLISIPLTSWNPTPLAGFLGLLCSWLTSNSHGIGQLFTLEKSSRAWPPPTKTLGDPRG